MHKINSINGKSSILNNYNLARAKWQNIYRKNALKRMKRAVSERHCAKNKMCALSLSRHDKTPREENTAEEQT